MTGDVNWPLGGVDGDHVTCECAKVPVLSEGAARGLARRLRCNATWKLVMIQTQNSEAGRKFGDGGSKAGRCVGDTREAAVRSAPDD